MRPGRWTLTLVLVAAIAIAVLLPLVLGGEAPPAAGPPEPAPPTPAATPPPPSETLSPSPTPAPPATPSPSPVAATPSPEATVSAAAATDGRPARCATVAERAAPLVVDIEDAMGGYEGVWGLALIDLDCESAIMVRPRYSQYPASAGKIVILTAALRAVQDGLLDFAAIEQHVELVLWHSLDKNTDEIAAFLAPAQVGEVLARARVSPASSLQWEWRDAWFTPHDLALVWASIVRGEQLDERWTAYLMRLASEAEFPDGHETFPPQFGVEGYEYGQKAGFWVSDDDPHHFVAAGFVRPEEGASAGFTFAFMLETWQEDVFEPQRRTVFPLVRDFVVGEVERSR